jgi:nucleoside-diphosphate-sugar epimerase
MENMVTIKDETPQMVILLLGAKGHLGTHLYSSLETSGISIQPFDSRSDDIDSLQISGAKILLDASRVNTTDPSEVRRDLELHSRLLDNIEYLGLQYVRIASSLEIRPHETVTEYLKWSRAKSERILWKIDAGMSGKLIYIPNVYGGAKSQSIVDRMIRGRGKNKVEQLRNPGQLREFVDIDTFCHAVINILQNVDMREKEIEISTSIEYNISSLMDYIIGNRRDLTTKARNISTEIGILQIEVVDQLKQYVDIHLLN